MLIGGDDRDVIRTGDDRIPMEGLNQLSDGETLDGDANPEVPGVRTRCGFPALTASFAGS